MMSLMIFSIVALLLASLNLSHTTVGAAVSSSSYEPLPAVSAQFETRPALSEPTFATFRATVPMTPTTTLTEPPLQVERTQVWLPLIQRAPSERTAIWQALVNTQQGYRLWYPSTGKATLYQPEGVLHILVDHATSPLVVQMFANPDQLSLEEWLDSPSNHRSAATAAACQHLVVNQQDACAYRLFAGDHWNTHLLLTYATDVYEFIYPLGGSQEGVFADIVATFIPGLAPDATDQGFTLIDREAAPPMLAQEIAPISVPYFNQGDARWASHRLGTCSVTIGSHGCAMTSMAMLFNYYQPSFTDPAALNQCLTNKGGYLNGCLLYWRNQCMPAGVTYSGSGDIDTELRNRRPVIVGVDGGAHWVVVIGRRSDGRYTINNPSSYSTSTLGPSVLDPGRISDIRRYNGTVAPPPATYSGEFVSQTFQPQMVAGSTQQVQVQLRNTGTGAWDANTKITALPRDQNHPPFYDPSWLGPNRIASPGVVQPGAIGVFQFTLRAPATPGSYRIEFDFVQEGTAWFRAPAQGSVFFPITVTAASATLQNNSFEDPAGPAPWQWYGSCNRTTYESGIYGVTAFHGTRFLATNRGEQPECTSFYQDIPYVPTPGATYTFALMIHAPPGTTRTGTLALWAMGGEQYNAYRTFTVSQQGWMCHEVSLTIQQSGHTGLRAEVYFPNEAIGVDTLFDYALVQEGTASLCPAVRVSGQVTDAEGAGLAGVTVSDGTRNATTNAEGAYTLNNVPPGTYTLTPTKDGYRFEPATRNVTVNGNVTGQNFAARLLTYTISGQVTDAEGAGLAGVTVSDGTRNATTNAEGAYTLNDVPPGTYTLTPTKEGYRFEPATRNVTVNANVTGQDFAARANPATGVVMELKPAATTMPVSGTINVALEIRTGDYDVDAAAAYLTFDPEVLEVTQVVAGTAFPISLLEKLDNTAGTLDLARGIITAPWPQGTFTLATVTFRAKQVAPDGTALTLSQVAPRQSDVTFEGASLLEDVRPATITVVEGAPFTVAVQLQGRPQPPHARLQVPLEVALHVPTATTTLYRAQHTTDDRAQFQLAGVVSGTYTLRVKHPQSLRVAHTQAFTDTTQVIQVGSLPTGDANNDNRITVLDFSLLAGTFGRMSGADGYDARADFNGDEMISVVDFSLLVSNFGQSGEPDVLNASRTGLTQAPLTLAQVGRDVRAGEEVTLQVAVEAPSGGLDGIAAYFDFDPAVLEVVDLVVDPTLEMELQREVLPTAGQINLVRGTLNATPPTGVVPLATMTFRARRDAQGTQITLVDDLALRQSLVTLRGQALTPDEAPWQLTLTGAGGRVYLPLIRR
ncbi:hypothetical protein A9Q02_18355 [Candidatus Chloroploca asiatica]|uniref:Cohesin domain-containing protein n=2 Tax=Candidatus Chloroploca asiatica TaxID=1506545 RepID=A0A2H3KHX6_9CHLR|nr:hypothetical protein A9Q02_18355 [Candidatus Chloroploca asiatica]